MTTATLPVTRDRLTTSVVALLALQVVHGATPAKTSSEGYAGLIAGVFALAATIAALVGLRRGRPWARPLAGLTGGMVAIGFVLYHVLPFHTPLTNPYVGEVGVGPWIPLVAVVLAGLACAYYARAQSEA